MFKDVLLTLATVMVISKLVLSLMPGSAGVISHKTGISLLLAGL